MTPIDQMRITLIDHITTAFLDVKRENGVSLHEADVIDNSGSDKERTAARQLDREACWQDVPEGDIERHDWILSFLDAKGLRYYAPAYMVWAVKHYKSSDSLSSDTIIYTFDPGVNTSLYEWNQSRYEVFTLMQKEAICRFLKFMLEYGDGFADGDVALRALNGYWGQFCGA